MSGKWLSSARLLAALLAIWFAGVALARAADRQPAAPGPVVLTISGAIGHANRGPVDPWADKLLAYHDIAFDKAMTFDRAALERLGMHEIAVHYPKWPGGHRFSGPLLRDVLKAAGVTGGVLRPLGLDGYSAEIPYEDAQRYPVILALKMDGKWLDLGGPGPAWLLYPYDDAPELRKQDDSKWVWGVFHIRADTR